MSMETFPTSEGTDDIQTLAISGFVTGLPAFVPRKTQTFCRARRIYQQIPSTGLTAAMKPGFINSSFRLPPPRGAGLFCPVAAVGASLGRCRESFVPAHHAEPTWPGERSTSGPSASFTHRR